MPETAYFQKPIEPSILVVETRDLAHNAQLMWLVGIEIVGHLVSNASLDNKENFNMRILSQTTSLYDQYWRF